MVGGTGKRINPSAGQGIDVKWEFGRNGPYNIGERERDIYP